MSTEANNLTVVCDCQECVKALCEHQEYTLDDFLARKKWAGAVGVSGRVNCERVFARATNRNMVHQVTIEKGHDKAWLCKHGIAALKLLGRRRVQVLWERGQAEKMLDGLRKAGEDVKLYTVNGRVSVVTW